MGASVSVPGGELQRTAKMVVGCSCGCVCLTADIFRAPRPSADAVPSVERKLDEELSVGTPAGGWHLVYISQGVFLFLLFAAGLFI